MDFNCSTVCDDGKLDLVHIIPLVIGVIVFIIGMCVATSLGVVLFKKASSCIGRCTMGIVQHTNRTYICNIVIITKRE